MGVVDIARFSVWQVNLNPVKGSEQAGFRPALVLSPNQMNNFLNTVIVAPMTTRIRNWPTRVAIDYDGKHGEVALDQLRTIDKTRLRKNTESLDPVFQEEILAVLAEIFAR
jgi:mRNA interferase MazF